MHMLSEHYESTRLILCEIQVAVNWLMMLHRSEADCPYQAWKLEQQRPCTARPFDSLIHTILARPSDGPGTRLARCSSAYCERTPMRTRLQL